MLVLVLVLALVLALALILPWILERCAARADVVVEPGRPSAARPQHSTPAVRRRASHAAAARDRARPDAAAAAAVSSPSPSSSSSSSLRFSSTPAPAAAAATMLLKDRQRLALLLGPLLLLVYAASLYYRQAAAVGGGRGALPGLDAGASSPPGSGLQAQQRHRQISSASTPDGKFVPIDFGGVSVLNPNILPHPALPDAWIIVAQRRNDAATVDFKELTCDAVLRDGALRCATPPAALPVADTAGGKCDGDLSYFNLNRGPHDARAFHGPDQPYLVFGSNSVFTCFGQFVQGLPALHTAAWAAQTPLLGGFPAATELQRPDAWRQVEKNWFLFWDDAGRKHVHHDLYPKRVYAELHADGSVGPNLAVLAAARDERCMARLMPRPAPALESIHQATNSLQITMCRRAEPGCRASEANTFLLTIFQHKTYYNFHSVYEPYVMLFARSSPFAVHALSRRPLWIHGRERRPERNSSDMFYVTSMAWKSRERSYAGFLDDDVFIAFGIEDERAGGIDVVAADLLADLAVCDEG